MSNLVKISRVHHGSTIRFNHEGKDFEGHNWRDGNGKNKVSVFKPGPSRTIDLSPDTLVEVLEVGGFTLEVS